MELPLSELEKPQDDDLARLPRVSLGALFMPAVWGPAHGQWVTILFYPLWIFADSCFVNGVLLGGLAAVLAVTVFIGMALITVFYARTAGRRAYLRVAGRIPLERYLRYERIWAFASLAIALLFFALATWYNLTIRLPQGITW